MSNERTKPRFPTYGPEDGSGRDWHQYFVDIKGREVEPEPESDPGDDDPPVESITIVIPATEVPEKWFNIGAPQGLRTWRNRLLANDWQFKLGAAQSWHETTYYKNGNLNSPAHFEEVWWINAVNGSDYLTISYNVRGGAVYSANTARILRGSFKLMSDAETKELVERSHD